MSEEQMLPNVPNSPPWSGDPNAPNAPDPSDPQWGGQVGVGGGVDQTTGTPATPSAGTGAGTNQDAGLGGGGSGYGGPVTPGGEADMPATDPGQSGNASWSGQGNQGQNQDHDRWAGESQGDHDSLDSGQPDTGYLNRQGSGDQDDVTRASQDSFPASDPPSFNPGRP